MNQKKNPINSYKIKLHQQKKKMMKFQQMNLKELIAQQMKDILMMLIWNQIFLTDLFFIGLLQF